MKRICVRARSPTPSSFFSDALCASTCASAWASPAERAAARSDDESRRCEITRSPRRQSPNSAPTPRAPRASAARGARGVGALLGDCRRGERVISHRRDSSSDLAAARSAGLAQAEAHVEAHSASLKKELGVGDLALTQILFIVGLTWIGVAGKLGPPHVVFWLLALVLFYLPSAAVVIYLNRLMPLEGGLYQWAKLGFNQTVGFMLAWNLWLYVIVFTSEIGLQCATYLSYAIGPRAAWMMNSSWFVALSSAVILSLMVVTSTIGLSVGKWVHNTGGVFMITIFGAVILLPAIGLLT